jgi:magnesium-transporting ATPase (P-type)
VVEKCKFYFAADGRPEGLSSAIHEKIENVNKEFASKCYRNIMVAYADISRDDFERMKAETNNFKTN